MHEFERTGVFSRSSDIDSVVLPMYLHQQITHLCIDIVVSLPSCSTDYWLRERIRGGRECGSVQRVCESAERTRYGAPPILRSNSAVYGVWNSWYGCEILYSMDIIEP